MLTRQFLQSGLLALCAVAGSSQAAQVDPATIDAIWGVWQNQHKALDAHDVAGVLATYADSDEIMLMGTGPGEHYIGKDEIKDAYTHFMGDFDVRTLRSKCGEGQGSTEGNVVWVTTVCQFNDQKAGVERQYTVNLSAVIVKHDAAWRFHSIHFSHLSGNAQGSSQ